MTYSKGLFVFIFSLFSIFIIGQTYEPPSNGPGSAIYPHDSVKFYDYAEEEDGYWLFEPAKPSPQTANLVVFIHGYGGLNPMIYGKWIRHLVRKGNVVIYPRYQKNMFAPSPKKFSENVIAAIQNALATLQQTDHVTANVESLCLVGHSYGGIIGAEITLNWKNYGIPEPKGIFLCAPGTGPFKAGKLESYEKLSKDLNLLIMVNENDYIVSDEMGVKIFETAINTPQRNLIRQYPDYENGISAAHNETYCIDEAFDTGNRNYTAKKALRISKVNAVDYYGYWKLFDALMDCSREGKNCHYAFGDTPEQKSLGTLATGKTLKELEVTLSAPKQLSVRN